MLRARRGRGSCQRWHLNNGGFLDVNTTRLTWRAPHCHFAFLEVYVQCGGDSWRSEKIASTVRDSSTPPRLNLFRKLSTRRHGRREKNSRRQKKWLKVGDKNKKTKASLCFTRIYFWGPKFSITAWKVCGAEGPQWRIPNVGVRTVCVAAVDVLLNKKKLPRSFYWGRMGPLKPVQP